MSDKNPDRTKRGCLQLARNGTPCQCAIDADLLVSRLTKENERLKAAIKLMDDQVSAGEGVSILYYFDRAYTGDPALDNKNLTEYCRELLEES